MYDVSVKILLLIVLFLSLPFQGLIGPSGQLGAKVNIFNFLKIKLKLTHLIVSPYEMRHPVNRPFIFEYFLLLFQSWCKIFL